uniref:Secreted protein n=1 Tax=Rhipicephalus appendiculatus TaxID=34631 RepID=A0A131YCH3_RHIAP
MKMAGVCPRAVNTRLGSVIFLLSIFCHGACSTIGDANVRQNVNISRVILGFYVRSFQSCKLWTFETAWLTHCGGHVRVGTYYEMCDCA